MAYNETAHENLIGNEYTYRHVEADWEDVGGPENGPKIEGHPAFDEYTSDEDYVFIDEYGRAFFEPRDLALEKWMDEMVVEFSSKEL